jgi:hypothetical protein
MHELYSRNSLAQKRYPETGGCPKSQNPDLRHPLDIWMKSLKNIPQGLKPTFVLNYFRHD